MLRTVEGHLMGNVLLDLGFEVLGMGFEERGINADSLFFLIRPDKGMKWKQRAGEV